MIYAARGLWARDANHGVSSARICTRRRSRVCILTFASGVRAIACFFARTSLADVYRRIMRVQVRDAPPQGHHIASHIHASVRARASQDGLRRT